MNSRQTVAEVSAIAHSLEDDKATKEIVMPAPAEGGSLSQYRLQCHGVVCNSPPPPPPHVVRHFSLAHIKSLVGRLVHNAFASLGWYLLPAALHRESSLVLASCGSPPPRGGGQRFHFRLPFFASRVDFKEDESFVFKPARPAQSFPLRCQTYDIGGNFVLESRERSFRLPTLDVLGRFDQECAIAAEMHFELLSWAKKHIYFFSRMSVADFVCHAPF